MLWLRHVGLPNVDTQRERIVASIEEATGMQVSMSAVRGDWEGLRPRLTLQDFRVADRQGRAALAFDRAEFTLSWWALLRAEVRFADVDFYRPDLTLRRGSDGLIYLADKALNAEGPDDDGALTRWLLSQPRLGVHDAGLTWRDDRGGEELRLEQVEIAIERQGTTHRAALTAAPRAGVARRVDLRAQARVRREGARWITAGDLYAEATQVDLARLRAHLPLPQTLRSGVGSARVWASYDGQRLADVVSDVTMRDATAQLADDAAALHLASLAGRIAYRALPGGFSVDTAGLRFRLAAGPDAASTGNFHISRAEAPNALLRTEVRADAVDLAVASTLLEYLPVPKELKAQVGRFAPRGRVSNARVTWTGDEAQRARTYTLDGRFEGVAVAAAEGFPGVAGLTGEISGTELGGEVRIASKALTLELARFFREPLRFDVLEAQAAWRHGDRPLEVNVAQARFTNADVDGEASGTWRAIPDAGRPTPGFVDFKGTFSRASATAVARYMPNKTENTRDWLARAIEAGTSPRVSFQLKGDLYEFPFGPGHPGHFLVEGDLRDGRLRYHPDWPAVDGVDGTFRFEDRRMEIRAARASIFASRATRVSAIVEDLRADPPLLTVEGEIGTSGADSMRFLRESPLVSGPGAFTRAVAVEGPGRLAIKLDYPLWGTQAVKVNGEYTFEGATATAGERLAMRDVRGKLAFTERGVTAPGLTGTLFGKPVTLAMATTDAAVVTTLDGRIDAAGLAQHVAPPIAARLAGETRWQARVTSGAQGVDLTVSSDLQGLAVTLPAPLAKPAAEARALTIEIAKLGTEAEATTAALAGGVHARFGRMRDKRMHAAVRFGAPVGDEPVREGLWLLGALPEADADAWIAVFATPRGAAAPAAAPVAQEGLALRGIDLALGRVRYFGRDFTKMRARLERRGPAWGGNLDSPRVAGVVQWNPEGRGRVMARLTRLSLEPGAEPAAAPPQPAAEGDDDLPELDIAAEHFEFRGKWLGRLDLEAKPAGAEWKIERLDITNGHARLKSSGEWRRTGAGARTALQVKLDADNLNSLLGQFGYGEYVRSGSGALEGRLVWPGHPYDFATHILSGTFRLEARRGQFSKIEPGAGKLLALLSLQSLPRRASFDFRDVFSEGFAFERMEGEVKLAKGILLVDGFEISGPSAFVSLTGEVSLPAETQAVVVRVVPEVGESMALAATLIGTPVLGLSTLIVSKLLKNPFGKVVAYEYQVTGSWDNPQVTRTSAAPPRAAAASPQESPAAPRSATP